VALGATELAAGALGGGPSLVQSVADVVIDLAPISVVRAAISTLGTRDKPVLVAGVVVLSLLFGAGIGLAARRRRWIGVAAFAAFGALGAWAGARPPNASILDAVLAGAAGVIAGVAVLASMAWRPARSVVPARGGATPAAPAPTTAAQPGATTIAGPGRTAVAGPGATTVVGPEATAPAGREATTAAGPGATTAAGPGVTTPARLGAKAGGPAASRPAAPRAALEVASRRAFLAGAGSLAVVGAAAAAGGRLLESRARVAARQVAGLPNLGASEPGPSTGLDVRGLSPFITPNGDFYRVDTATFLPLTDVASWRLKVGGMVDHPFELTYNELLAMSTEEHVITLACVSNEVGDRLSGNARWRGVRLDELLRRAGPRPEASQLVGLSLDGFSTGFPTALALDGRNAMVAVAMNGQPLPDPHGFPARLVVPGVYGYASACKWLAEIRLDRLDGFQPYWMERGWATGGEMRTMSRIDTPIDGRGVRAGKVPIAGVAWTNHVGISKVEVQVDERPWMPARLGPGDIDSWRQWVVDWDATAGTHTIRVRATDGRGRLQTSQLMDAFPSGATGWHTIQVKVMST
jgi:DMSO/TMAO reductase YedYZ molybdopterin-dependent catalytic subunit